MSSPKVWGKYFWTTLHISALGFPETPTPEEVAAYRAFYEGFGDILPCKKCAKNYVQHLKELPLDSRVLASRDALFAWTVKLHNIVNKEHGKAQWTAEYAKEFYMSGSYNDCELSRDAASVSADVWRLVLLFMILINVIVILYLVVSLRRK